MVDPGQYAPVLVELEANGGAAETRFRLSAEAFARTASYDSAIARIRAATRSTRAARAEVEAFPARLDLTASRLQGLRYGENPHQSAAFYGLGGAPMGLAAARPLHGPELSYNNLLDWSAALGLLLEFDDPAAVVIKHTNPCGVAVGAAVGDAMRRANACDPVSIYGGIVGVNRTLDLEVVKELSGS